MDSLLKWFLTLFSSIIIALALFVASTTESKNDKDSQKQENDQGCLTQEPTQITWIMNSKYPIQMIAYNSATVGVEICEKPVRKTSNESDPIPYWENVCKYVSMNSEGRMVPEYVRVTIQGKKCEVIKVERM